MLESKHAAGDGRAQVVKGPGNYREADEDSWGEADWDAPAAELSGEAGCSSFVQQVGLLFACFAVFETWSPIA